MPFSQDVFFFFFPWTSLSYLLGFILLFLSSLLIHFVFKKINK